MPEPPEKPPPPAPDSLLKRGCAGRPADAVGPPLPGPPGPDGPPEGMPMLPMPMPPPPMPPPAAAETVAMRPSPDPPRFASAAG